MTRRDGARPELRILLVDDDRGVRRAARTVLEADGRFAVVGDVDADQGGVSAAGDLRPQLVLVGEVFRRPDPVQAVRELRQACPACRVVIQCRESPETQKLLAAGADLVVPTDTGVNRLLDLLADLAPADWPAAVWDQPAAG